MKKVRAVAFSKSPVLNEDKNKWRSIFLLGFVLLLLASLIARAAYLQIYKQEFLQDKGEARYSRNITLPANRGRILDRNGEILAMSLPVKSIWAEPTDAANLTPGELENLAKLLDMKSEDIKHKIAGKKNFVYLKRQVEPEISKQIAEAKFPGIHQENTFKRYYSTGTVNSHITGFTDVEEAGQEGIELAFDKTLAGINGERKVLKNRRGQVIEEVGPTIEPENGRDIQLTIDNRIQHIAAIALKETVDKHKAKAASAVVLDAKTGEILALVNYPTYDPNTRDKLTGDKLRNRAIVDIFEPGSIIKPFIVAMALDKNIMREDTVMDTSSVVVGGKSVQDAHGHPVLTMAQVLQKSSNIGTVKIGMKFTPQEMWDVYNGVGFGQKVGVGFPGEAKGLFRKPNTWKPIEQATMSFGHGLAVSLMQMAHSYLAFTNEGKVHPVSLVKTDAEKAEPKQIFSESTAKRMLVLMESVTSKEGTAYIARTPSYRVAGKTGTAHKLENGRYVNKYIGSFVGFAPASNPKIIVAVSIDEPKTGGYYGGVVSGPAFSKITESSLKVLGVAPDKYADLIIDGKKVEINLIPKIGQDGEMVRPTIIPKDLPIVGAAKAEEEKAFDAAKANEKPTEKEEIDPIKEIMKSKGMEVE